LVVAVVVEGKYDGRSTLWRSGAGASGRSAWIADPAFTVVQAGSSISDADSNTGSNFIDCFPLPDLDDRLVLLGVLCRLFDGGYAFYLLGRLMAAVVELGDIPESRHRQRPSKELDGVAR
jgi:hypothetical protein